jgi:carbonic anhydrase
VPEKKKLRDRLIKRFYTKFNPEAYDGQTGTMPGLVANDQHPEVLFITCIDSRVAPSMIFRMKPGESLNHRHISALVPPYETDWEKPGANLPAVAASIDFAVRDKKVLSVIIKGHTQCGGVKAYVEGSASPLVKAWMEHAKPVLNKLDRTLPPDALLRQAERECVKYSLHNLLTYPSVKDAIAKGDLLVEGWLHDIEKGVLLRLDPQTGDFVEIREDGSDVQKGAGKGPPHTGCTHI